MRRHIYVVWANSPEHPKRARVAVQTRVRDRRHRATRATPRARWRPRGAEASIAATPTRRARDSDSDDGEGRRHHTLTLAQGRALRRELSRHTLHALGGERVCEESSPETTLESARARALGDALLRTTVGADATATTAERGDAGTRDAEAVERERRSTERRASRHSIDGRRER